MGGTLNKGRLCAPIINLTGISGRVALPIPAAVWSKMTASRTGISTAVKAHRTQPRTRNVVTWSSIQTAIVTRRSAIPKSSKTKAHNVSWKYETRIAKLSTMVEPV